MAEKPDWLPDVLRRAIRDSGLTHYRLAKDSGVSATILDRFMSGERGISFVTAAKIAGALGFVLVPKKGKS